MIDDVGAYQSDIDASTDENPLYLFNENQQDFIMVIGATSRNVRPSFYQSAAFPRCDDVRH